MRKRFRYQVPGPVHALLLAAASGCSDRTTEPVCYERDAALDTDVDPLKGEDPPYCRWAPGELPEPASGFSDTRKIFLAFRPTESQPCDPCDLEAFDALLNERVREECDLPYELVRGCYIPSAPEDGDGLCWVEGLYYSNCDLVNYPPKP